MGFSPAEAGDFGKMIRWKLFIPQSSFHCRGVLWRFVHIQSRRPVREPCGREGRWSRGKEALSGHAGLKKGGDEGVHLPPYSGHGGPRSLGWILASWLASCEGYPIPVKLCFEGTILSGSISFPLEIASPEPQIQLVGLSEGKSRWFSEHV
jgi:hypothetical protein